MYGLDNEHVQSLQNLWLKKEIIHYTVCKTDKLI